MKTENIMGKDCYIFSHIVNEAAVKYCIYLGTGEGEENGLQGLFEYLESQVKDKSYMLIAYESSDWNRDFSPWEAPAVFGREGFAGGASQTLKWLVDECITFLDKTYLHGACSNNLLAGYSLAGLFSLWAFYTSGVFSGVSSCSGSLWFPGWMEFVKNAAAPKESVVYLSLGNKEEYTKNKVMAGVGDATREMDMLLERDRNVLKHTLEWNIGGHFNETSLRTAKGIAWLLQQFE
jgi:predicted alpha/beta superfamily hydrolase